jgi:hypothetical protein
MDATNFFLGRLGVADLASRNPDHWPCAPSTLTLSDLMDGFVPLGYAF